MFLLTLSCVLLLCEGQGSSDIRLVGGRNRYEGRVEVNRSGEWQTVCDDSWDIEEAEVVCRQLGYGYAILERKSIVFGWGSDRHWMRDWSCYGNETNLDDCRSSAASVCDLPFPSVVFCSGNALSNGSLRLVNAWSSMHGGRLEVYYNNEWGTVCDDSWDSSDAIVACGQMGFLGVGTVYTAVFGYGATSQRIWLDDVACNGSESQLTDCSHAGIGNDNCSHSEDVGIICSIGSSDIRLVGGKNQYEGRVKVFRSGEWQTVCDNSWDIQEAEVVCRELGYGYAVLAIQGATFGQGSGGQWKRNWSCNGNETRLADCSSNSVSCSHSEDASAICSANALSNGALRLVNTGSSLFGGRLEINYKFEWGTVCGDSWDVSDAIVACRQMGFLDVTDSYAYSFGPGALSQRIWLDNVACSGSESQLIDCSHAGYGNENCGHSGDVRILCAIGYSDLRLVGGRNQYEGRVEVYLGDVWQTVCDNHWDIEEAEVVCHQLGYGYAILAIQGAAFGQGSGRQWKRNLHCKGNEASLTDCRGTSASCSHADDASVICSGIALSNGSLRLVNTRSIQFGGRLELYYDNEWGTVCNDASWGKCEATVACKQMGFTDVTDYNSSVFRRGSSSQNIWLDDVDCTGSESRLIDCRYSSIMSSCSHRKDVGIVCGPVNIGAIIGGAVGGGVFICVALCICIGVCCWCKKKKKCQRLTPTTAVSMTSVQPAPVAAVNETAVEQSARQEDNIPPEYNPEYNPEQEAGSELYPTTYTRPSPYPPLRGRTLPPTKAPSEDTLPPAYPTVDDGTLPPPYPAPGGALTAGYPPQQPHTTQPPDLPPPYPVAASPFYTQ